MAQESVTASDVEVTALPSGSSMEAPILPDIVSGLPRQESVGYRRRLDCLHQLPIEIR